jgi:hypothetical protein
MFNKFLKYSLSASIHILASFTTECVTWWILSQSLMHMATWIIGLIKSSRVHLAFIKSFTYPHTWKLRGLRSSDPASLLCGSPQPIQCESADSGTVLLVDCYVGAICHSGSTFVSMYICTFQLTETSCVHERWLLS